jgi:ferrochelatase
MTDTTRPRGILLVNLGTPLSCKPEDVKVYLTQFLMDPRVIDLPYWKRLLLVRGIIVPFRHKQSAATYAKVWQREGSPLLVHSQKLTQALQDQLEVSSPGQYKVQLAMRYQEPSIQKAFEALLAADVSSITIVPLFPQYASATTGSIYEECMRILSSWSHMPELRIISSFYNHPLFIRAWAETGRPYLESQTWDQILFSFHGLPEKQLTKQDRHNHCLKAPNCCDRIDQKNQFCYRAQCVATARSIAKELNIAPEQFTIAFQSRLGKGRWLHPYMTQTLADLAAQGKKNILVFSPSFVADCIETIYEIQTELHEEFVAAGGHHLQLVPSLNDSPAWTRALEDLILQ